MDIAFEEREKVRGLPGLKRARLNARITQEVLSERSEVTQATISNLERGQHIAADITVAKLAHALGVKREDLVE